MKKGFTLIEVLVGTAVFLVVAMAVYQAYTSLFLLISANQYKILALNLANEQFEIVRNLTYSSVGETTGIPHGVIPHSQMLTRGGVTFVVTTTIRNVDLPFDGVIDGTPDDLSPADNKLIEVEVSCDQCKGFTPVTLTTTVAPKNLETASTNGALFVRVFDANGNPVSGADVHIVNSAASIVIDDVTGANGMLQIVDAPPGLNAYAITVSKPGYSSARTYPPGDVANPTPTQPDATVVIQQVTQVSFSIDQLSSVSISSITPVCVAVPNIDFSLTGSKNIGASLPKYSVNHVTNGSGAFSNSTMEWDSYTIAGLDATYDIVGLNPLNAIAVSPGGSQHIDLIVAPKNPKSLLVTVKDAGTGLPVTGATVTLTDPDDEDTTQVTDRGYINQTDWSTETGGDAGIETSSPAGILKLKDIFGTYAPTGIFESSTIDTGISSNFSNLVWSPTDQPPSAGLDSVKFQFATNIVITATTTWSYKGPDGTSGTYYTLADTAINSIHNGDRYVRYKAFLSTVLDTVTPTISDIAFTYTSSCIPPGQVIFSGLSNGTYKISVSKAGYGSVTDDPVSISTSFLEKEVTLSP